MAVPILPMLKYSVVNNLLNFPPIFIKCMSEYKMYIVCKVLYFKAQYLLKLRSPLIQNLSGLGENVIVGICTFS